MIELDFELPLARFPLRVRASLAGDAVAVLGRSGSGKTSLLESIAGLRHGARGRIAVGGERLLDTAAGRKVAPERRRIGYVPQDALLFPHLDVAGNVRFALARGDGERTFREAVEILEIGDLLSRFPATLSGGERQRIALARALATAPRLLLLDEPFAAVDVELRARILPYLLRVRDEKRVPFLYVTHNAGEALAVAREAILLESGAIARQGPPEDVVRPALASLDPQASFENIVEGALEEVDLRGGTGTLQTRAGTRLAVPATATDAPGARRVYAVSPRDILVATQPLKRVSARNVLVGEVIGAEASEADLWLRVRAQGVSWTCLVTRQAGVALGLEVGTPVWLAIKTHSLRPLH